MQAGRDSASCQGFCKTQDSASFSADELAAALCAFSIPKFPPTLVSCVTIKILSLIEASGGP